MGCKNCGQKKTDTGYVKSESDRRRGICLACDNSQKAKGRSGEPRLASFSDCAACGCRIHKLIVHVDSKCPEGKW